MSRFDRSVVAALLLALVALSVAVAIPREVPVDDAAALPSPSAAVDLPYREGMVGEPTSISPFGARTPADRALVALSFSGLVKLGPGQQLLPDLAAGWTVDPKGASYTFTLRPDATWQDGQPVTAEDVAFTIGALKDPTYTGPGGASWRDVTVTVVDPRTVRFELANPIPGFLYAATQPLAPAHLLKGVSPADLASDPFGQRPVGSGPFRLVSWNAKEALLEAVRPPSSSPAAGARPISRIEFTFSDDPATLVAAYRAGELDALSGLQRSMAAQLGSEAGSHLLRYPASTLTAVILDLRAGRADFSDARARRGLLEAIDRDAIVRDQLGGLASRADVPIPPTSWVFDATSSPPVAADVAAAAKDLAAGGWKRVENGWVRPGATAITPIRLLSPDAASSPTLWAVANAVASDWRAVGLTVDVVGMPTAELVTKHLRPGDFDAAVLDIALGLDPDLYPLLASSQTIGGGSNVSGLQDPKLDAKLAAARRLGSVDERLAAWKDLQAYLASGTFLLPMAFPEEVVVARDRLVGPVVRQIGDASDRFYDVLTWRLADDR